MDFVSFRADKELKKQLEQLADLENKNKSDEYREIFLLGIEEKLKSLAVEKYRKGEFSAGMAAGLANTTIWEFMGLLKERKIPMNLTSEDVLRGIDNL